jgi:hypothetical protein
MKLPFGETTAITWWRDRATVDRTANRRQSKCRQPPMPFKSQAQRRKFAELLVQGKISNETFEEWNRETGSKKLPERVKRKRTTARKRR